MNSTETQIIIKLTGHTDRLVDAFSVLKERSIFVNIGFKARKRFIRSGRGRAHRTVVADLFLLCAQETAILVNDKSDKVPSFTNIFRSLGRPGVVTALRDGFSRNTIPASASPLDLEYLQHEQRAMTRAYRRRFNRVYSKLMLRWSRLTQDPRLQKFQILRDKRTAHFELSFAGGEYRSLDINSLGIKWADLGGVVREIERVVLALNLIIRKSSNDLSSLNKEARQDAKDFWT
jgi:hypothetical protein